MSNSYIVSSGLLQANADHALHVACFASEIIDLCKNIPGVGAVQVFNINDIDIATLHTCLPTYMWLKQVRIGIHAGPLTGGVIGRLRKFFRIFGDTVGVIMLSMATTLFYVSYESIEFDNFRLMSHPV